MKISFYSDKTKNSQILQNGQIFSEQLNSGNPAHPTV